MTKLQNRGILSKQTVLKAVPLLPSLPGGDFHVFLYIDGTTTKAIVFRSRVRCSEIGPSHNELHGVPLLAVLPIQSYVNIGAGSAFLGEPNLFEVKDDSVATRMDKCVYDLNEAQRRKKNDDCPEEIC